MKDFFCIAGRQPCTSDRPSHRSGYYFTFLLFQPCTPFRAKCGDAPRESAIFNRNARRLQARARFSTRMCGRSTRERDFPRECEDAPRESAVFNKNERFFLHRGPPTLYVGPPFSPVGLLFYYFTISTMYAISSKNARTLHARARFSTRMRGRFTRERDFQPECADAPRESTIFNGNARTLHARA